MTRAAIYSRFSTDLQSERSIEDQVALCEAYAAREGLSVTARFEDRARSGGSVLGRDGLMRMMEAAKDGGFEVVVVEALDRLSRDMEDLAGLHKRLTFAGIEIRAVHEGQVNTMLVGLRGLIGQLYREDNAHKIRRGMAGRVRDGLSGGGSAYGYAADPAAKGKRVIVEEEAAIVRRIFESFTGGQSPRAIAHALNAEGIAPPRGRAWNASTINGSATRGNGILRNPLYAGRLVWNRLRMVKDPETGRRVSRPNPESEWQVTAAPDLAIVDAALYDAVQAMKEGRAGVAPRLQQRPKRILSGLLRCGGCGGGMSTYGGDRTKRTRVMCSRHRESRSCPAPRSFYVDTVEKAVLGGLRAELEDPAVIAEYVRAYHEERKRLAAGAGARRASLEKKAAALAREIDRLVDAIAKGAGDPAVLGPRSTALYKEKTAIEADLATLAAPVNVVALHPVVMARYREQLDTLGRALGRGLAGGDGDAAAALRDLVESVTLHPDPARDGGIHIEVKGRLTALLGPGAWPNGVSCGVVVAEDGFEPPTRGL
ncbi:MAG: recombinase family protein [Parvibaculum sp.]|uniref:recombinase family protein n=1 Tax=Parvibaculum sp. TaxID=2024848 RepID=UPI0027300E6F|nr:recombinase family protein [Parvibaculum sp.]MDP1628816.1 recombinase family protein [Parvibaculum sp.]MDP2148211.1 recombinase family protein [Parvibaculum sp.]